MKSTEIEQKIYYYLSYSCSLRHFKIPILLNKYTELKNLINPTPERPVLTSFVSTMPLPCLQEVRRS